MHRSPDGAQSQWILKGLGGTVYTIQNLGDSLFVSTSTNAQPGGTVDLQAQGYQFNFTAIPGQTGVYKSAIKPV